MRSSFFFAMFTLAHVSFSGAQSVWEQVTGSKPPVDIPVPTIPQLAADPIKTLVNPTSYINQTGIPTQGDVFEFVIKNPEAAIELTQNPGDWPYVPVATAMISARNSVVTHGGAPIPDNVKSFLRRWHSDELLNSIRWTTNWGPFQNTFQAAKMGFNEDTEGITVINAIIFRNPNVITDLSLWAHEVYHVQQYHDMGVFGFAKAWVDNSGNGGPIEAPAYARGEEARRILSSLPQDAVGFSRPSRNFTTVDKLPPPWVRCIFFANTTENFFVTIDNRIVVLSPNSPPEYIGERKPPRFPQCAWTYQTALSSYDVMPNGQIWIPTGPNGTPLQVGYIAPP